MAAAGDDRNMKYLTGCAKQFHDGQGPAKNLADRVRGQIGSSTKRGREGFAWVSAFRLRG